MLKRWLLVGMIFLLVPWLLVSCGVAQEQYDAVVSDLSEAQQELQSVKAELETAKAKVSELTSSVEKGKTDLEATQADLEVTQADLEATQTDLSAAQSTGKTQEKTMEKARTFAEVISTLFVPILKGETINELELAVQWISSLQAIEDPEAERLANAIISSGGGEQEFTDFYLYIFDNLPKILK